MNTNILQEMIGQSIDSAIEQLKNDSHYIKHRKLLEKSIEDNDIDALLIAQITLHNMELEAAYCAGHHDCLQYLTYVNAIQHK